jgi:hypothetical protein
LQFGKRQDNNPAAMHLMQMMNAEPYKKYIQAKTFNFQGGNEIADHKALEDAGFVDIDVKVVESHPPPEQLEKMREFMRNTTFKDVAKSLPDDLRAKFEKEAEQAMGVVFSEEHPFEFLQVRARMPRLH